MLIDKTPVEVKFASVHRHDRNPQIRIRRDQALKSSYVAINTVRHDKTRSVHPEVSWMLVPSKRLATYAKMRHQGQMLHEAFTVPLTKTFLQAFAPFAFNSFNEFVHRLRTA